MDEGICVVRAGAGEEVLVRAAVEGVQGRGVEEGAVREFLRDEGCYVLVAVAGEEVVGCLVGYAMKKLHRGERQMLLYSVDVKEGWRGRGVGTGLVRGFVEEGKAAGAYAMWVLTNEGNRAAVRVYERCGFRRVNRDDVMMEVGL